uniref:Uncharacterized protein n=1 Tax=Skeletonema marinoi TaxID=267567 RepID=A0A7S2KR50_9STRA|mmetsp:Transcript_15278/g.25791  ORF Transcript_15278/g.25791 Transcript_15278/m.25791 type:complete len:482 (+) Transcript_15278:87-1532(+)
MGKKNRKARPHDDDDLLLGGTSPVANDQQEVGVNPPDESSANASAAKQQHTVNIDLLLLEQQMADLLRNYPSRPDDWLYRTIEKNMKLPKHSLKKSLDPHILDQMRRRVENMVYAEEDEQESALLDEGGGGKNEHDERIYAYDEAMLRVARMAGIDPDEFAAAYDIVREDSDEQDVSNTEAVDQTMEEEDLQSLQNNMTFAVSSLIALQPYTMDTSSDGALFTRFFLLLRQYASIIICQLLSVLFGQKARQRATLIWQKIHLPKIEAELLAKEKEEDLQMLDQNAHLWSDENECWIEKDQVHHPPLDGDEAHTLPSTIRWNPARKQWERWSKNLTTRTKKQTSGSSLTKGTFLPAREGEGWATSPNEAEIENKQLTTQGIRFFACLPNNDDSLDVVDVTSWAATSLLPKEAARLLDAVDSGRVLFSFDVPAVNKKGAGKGKQKKKKKGAEAKQASSGNDCIALKGIGATAQVSERYLNKMQ